MCRISHVSRAVSLLQCCSLLCKRNLLKKRISRELQLVCISDLLGSLIFCLSVTSFMKLCNVVVIRGFLKGALYIFSVINGVLVCSSCLAWMRGSCAGPIMLACSIDIIQVLEELYGKSVLQLFCSVYRTPKMLLNCPS